MANYRVPVLEKFEYQPPVIAYQSAPPGSPTKGNRYIVLTTGTGAWAGHDEAIATYDGAAWIFDNPGAVGWVAYLQSASKFYYFSGTAWAELDMKPKTHVHAGADITSGTLDGDRLAAPTTTKRGGVKATGTPSGKFLKDDDTWATPAASVPTGTGFRKVVAGVEDAAAKLVENAEVHASAAIAESKLALNYATHSPANDPSSGEKAALPGTSGTPGSGNKYVTDQDARNTNARTPVAHEHAGADISSGTVDGDRLPGLSATKKGGAPATGTPSGKYLKDDGTWATPAGGDMTKAVYDTDADNIVDKAEAVDDGAGNATTAAQVKEAYDKRGAYDADYKCLTFVI